MIQVSVHYQENNIKELTVQGHAEAGPHGHDLVCAGVSAIMNGAFNTFNHLTAPNVDLIVEDNLLKIQIKTISDHIQELMTMLNIQLATIADQYPQNIQMREVR